MKKIVLLCGMICISVCALCQTKLQVTVTHIKGQKGDIIVGIFDSDENFLKKPIDSKNDESCRAIPSQLFLKI